MSVPEQEDKYHFHTNIICEAYYCMYFFSHTITYLPAITFLFISYTNRSMLPVETENKEKCETEANTKKTGNTRQLLQHLLCAVLHYYRCIDCMSDPK